MKTHPKQKDVENVEQETYELLKDIGLPYKKVSKYEYVNEEGTAVWIGDPGEDSGVIKIYLGCDAEAVAHEIGHSFHEALNHNKKAVLPHPFRYPEDDEAVAEAVRFFIVQRRRSSWRPTRNTQTLDRCGYDFDTFRALVKPLGR
jgi:hypothetical protein